MEDKLFPEVYLVSMLIKNIFNTAIHNTQLYLGEKEKEKIGSELGRNKHCGQNGQ